MTQNLRDELQRRFTDLSSGRIGLPELLSWAGQLDLEEGRKPVGAQLFATGRAPDRLEGFKAPDGSDCQSLARAIEGRMLALEDVVGLVTLRHLRGASEGSLLHWLVRFGALHPSQIEDLGGGDDTDR